MTSMRKRQKILNSFSFPCGNTSINYENRTLMTSFFVAIVKIYEVIQIALTVNFPRGFLVINHWKM